MEFKIGDKVKYKDPQLVGYYIVCSEDPNEFWLQSITFSQVFLKYSPEIMTKYE